MSEPGLMDSRILILDDQRENVHLLEKIFRNAGYAGVRGITRPQEFMDVLLEFKPDLILLDLMMPYMNGYEILNIVRNVRRDLVYLPVIVLTADVSRESKSMALQSGANDFLVKPFDNEEVVIRARNLLVTRQLHKRLADANGELDAKNRLLDGLVRERTRDMEEARLEILNRLAKAAEFRDDDTGQHTQRVGDLSRALARQIGLPEEECGILHLAAPLHDVGKIGVSDTILLKPGKLTPEEFEAMKAHTHIGAKILAGSKAPVLIKAEELALTHHEKWDGSGYPSGLSGEDIPLSGRILAVADVFDALSHDRVYRKAWPREKVLAHIGEGAGTHFDPRLAKAFLTFATG